MVQIYYSNLNNTKEAKEKRFKDEQKCRHENTQAASDLALQCTEDECKLLNSTELGNHQRYIYYSKAQSVVNWPEDTFNKVSAQAWPASLSGI